ncbi:anti-sigma factor antagonist [Salicibibacter halophilus]|uniref:Anti-sigma factor antagonist n=1 Tax=Salicibibacter halophilus TaxID=2502791 RepID=A0A514LLR9_9BACI|nr:STAS domain-containing protein [Salicibibacter halophilus]QDI92475.1 anti-sigma factor antagonist [Salicibibacter halophilus]
MNLDVKTETLANEMKMFVSGEIDTYTAPQLKEALMPLAGKPGATVTVDLGGVDYIDSTGLGIFVGALKAADQNNGTLRLVSLNERVQRLFSITGLDEVIDIEERRESAGK